MKFRERLQSLGFATYADYLKSPHWVAFRREYKRAGNRMTCLVCAATPIQLHHQTYVRVGRERFTDVVPLCRSHHEAVHQWLKDSGRVFVEHTHEAVAALGGSVLPTRELAKKTPKKKRKGRKKVRDQQTVAPLNTVAPAGSWAAYVARVVPVDDDGPAAGFGVEVENVKKTTGRWRSSVFRRARKAFVPGSWATAKCPKCGGESKVLVPAGRDRPAARCGFCGARGI